MTAIVLTGGAALLVSCDSVEMGGPTEPRAPEGVRPGTRLPFTAVGDRVDDWSFAAPVEEIALETPDGQGGYRSVTLWCVVVDRKLFIATDSSKRPKRWVRELEAMRVARVGIDGRAYPVRAVPVEALAVWDAVVDAYERKYAAQIGRYDFPKRGDMTRGRIYELVSASPPP